MVGLYLKDSWRISDSLTANLGLRWDYQHTYLPSQTHDTSPDFPTVWPAGSYDYTTLQTWKRASPRVGVAWNGKRLGVFKAFAGTYGYVFGAQQGINYNRNALQYDTFRWHDLNGDHLYQPGEVDLNVNGPDFVSVNGAVGNKITSSLKQPLYQEYSASYEPRTSTGTSATSTICPDRTRCVRRAPTTSRSPAAIRVQTVCSATPTTAGCSPSTTTIRRTEDWRSSRTP
jgi:hypothetical protein